MRAIRWIVALGVLLFLIGAWLPAATDVAGTYQCSGETLEGQTYTLDLTISADGETWKLVWTDRGIRQAQGIGILDGDVLAGAYMSTNGIVGVVHFHVAAGRLDGQWAVAYGPLAPEVCTQGERPA